MKTAFLTNMRKITDAQLVTVLFAMIESNPTIAEEFAKRVSGTVEQAITFKVPGRGEVINLTQEQVDTLKNFGPERKVTAIKFLREATGLGLKEAKDLVEENWYPYIMR